MTRLRLTEQTSIKLVTVVFGLVAIGAMRHTFSEPRPYAITGTQESRAVYPLPASELAKLREQGVPDRVIDHMQQSHIDSERYMEWLRARDAYFPYGPYPYSFRGRYYYWW